MELSIWLRKRILGWLMLDPNTATEKHTHINFAVEAAKISNDLKLGNDDILVLMTDQVLGESLIKKLRADCLQHLGKNHQKIMILQGGLQMGVIHQEATERVELEKGCTNDPV